jgi:hypothetical protein
MDNIVRDIKATLYERVTNPFFGIFFLWWFVINFDFVLIVTGHNTTLDALRSYYGYTTCLNGKFSSILCLCSEINAKLTYHWYLAIYSVILPCIMTFFTTYVLYPIIAKTIYHKHSEELSKLKSIKKKIENAELLTMEESQKIRSLHKTLEVERDSLRQQLQSHVDITNSNKRSHESTVESKESEIKRLKNDIESKNKQHQIEIDRLKEEKQKLEDKVNKREYHNYSPIDYIEEILLSESLNDFIKFYEEYLVRNIEEDDENFTKEFEKLIQEKIKDKNFILFLKSYKLGNIQQTYYNNQHNSVKSITLDEDLCGVLYREIKKKITTK